MCRTRFAPSPTGYLHIGGARTALFSWLYAKQQGGEFILRIEDTDIERSTEDSIQAILEGMSWLGLNYNEGPFYQTDRFDQYKKVIQQLLDEDKAYYCYCSKEELEQLREQQLSQKEKPKYNQKCRHNPPQDSKNNPVIRFKNPQEGEVIINDLVRGQVTIKNQELDDLIIARSDGTPTYNLTVVVDDLDMDITHVIRGDDHLNNTPRQINIIQAMGGKIPQYAHLPMILGDDGKRLSKRHGAVSVLQYRDDGFLPQALLNYLVRLGWASGDKEIFSIDEMISLFNINDVNKAASCFDNEKLLWLNQHYIKTIKSQQLIKPLKWHFNQLYIPLENGPDLIHIIEIQKDRVKTLKEMAITSQYFYQDFNEFDEKAAKKNLRPVILEPMLDIKRQITDLANWTAENLHHLIDSVATSHNIKMGKIGQPLRVAVTGGSSSPSIDETLFLIGKEKVGQRLEKAITYIQQRAQT